MQQPKAVEANNAEGVPPRRKRFKNKPINKLDPYLVLLPQFANVTKETKDLYFLKKKGVFLFSLVKPKKEVFL